MSPRFIITPYDPVLWLPENLDKYGIPGSDLIVTLLDFAVDDGWHLHHFGTRDFSMIADGKLSISGSVLEHHILVFEIASGLKVPQFVQWYRAHIPERYELYLFVDDSRTTQKYIPDTSLKLTPDTSLEDIAHFTGYPVERVVNPVESTQKPVYAWHFFHRDTAISVCRYARRSRTHPENR